MKERKAGLCRTRSGIPTNVFRCYFITVNIIHHLNDNNINRLFHHKLPQVRSSLWILLGLQKYNIPCCYVRRVITTDVMRQSMCKAAYKFTESVFYYDLFFARPIASNESARCEKFRLKDQRLYFEGFCNWALGPHSSGKEASNDWLFQSVHKEAHLNRVLHLQDIQKKIS